jgi:hypothetical protein
MFIPYFFFFFFVFGSKDQHPKTKIKLEYTDVRNEKQQ